MDALHLTGPAPAVGRLAKLAIELGLPHRAAPGSISVTMDALGPLLEAAAAGLAPLEGALVRVVKADLDAISAADLLARTATAPTLANMVARRRHHRLLQAVHDRDGVHVGYQPVVDLAADRVMGYEALLRVRVDGQDRSPADVLAAADDAGRLAEIDGVARSVALAEAGAALGDRVLFINVLAASLPVPTEQLAPLAAEAIEHGIDPGNVVLEAPVGPAGTGRRQLEAVFRAAHDAGFRVGLDNVRSDRDLDAIGIRPDVVKLDRSLIRGLPSPSGTRALGQLVRDCGHAASMLVAQGIESAEQLRVVRGLGVVVAQGWQLGRPGRIAAEEARAVS